MSEESVTLGTPYTWHTYDQCCDELAHHNERGVLISRPSTIRKLQIWRALGENVAFTNAVRAARAQIAAELPEDARAEFWRLEYIAEPLFHRSLIIGPVVHRVLNTLAAQFSYLNNALLRYSSMTLHVPLQGVLKFGAWDSGYSWLLWLGLKTQVRAAHCQIDVDAAGLPDSLEGAGYHTHDMVPWLPEMWRMEGTWDAMVIVPDMHATNKEIVAQVERFLAETRPPYRGLPPKTINVLGVIDVATAFEAWRIQQRAAGKSPNQEHFEALVIDGGVEIPTLWPKGPPTSTKAVRDQLSHAKKFGVLTSGKPRPTFRERVPKRPG